LLVCVQSASNGSRWIGCALGVDDTVGTIKHRVDAAVVWVHPVAACASFDLALNNIASSISLNRHFHPSMEQCTRPWALVAVRRGERGCYDAFARIVTSTNGALVTLLRGREIIAHMLTTIPGAAVQVTHVAIVGREIANRSSLRLTAALHLATSINGSQLKRLLVCVQSAANGSRWIGCALRVDETIGAREHRVDTSVVWVNPVAACACFDLGLNNIASSIGLNRHFHPGMGQ